MVRLFNLGCRWKFIGCLAIIPCILFYYRIYKKVTKDDNKAVMVDFQQFLRKEDFHKGQTIPKILHQIWSDEIIPDQFVEHVKSLLKYNHYPEWEYYFWTLDAGQKFIEKNYPKLKKMYNASNKITKANILRTVVIYHFGGVYFDLDVVGVRPLDRFVENHECSLVAPIPEFFVVYDQKIDNRAVNNAMFLCRAQHPFFKLLVERTENRSESCYSNNVCSSQPEYPEPLLIELTDNGYQNVPEVVDYHLFDCKYDPVVTKLLEKKCLGLFYKMLEPAKQKICDGWKRLGQEKRLVHENAYTFHTWYHANARKVTFDPKNRILNIAPHAKLYNNSLEGHLGNSSDFV